MGVVDFDPDKWAKANHSDAEQEEAAKAANPAKVEGVKGELSQLSQLSQPAAGALPADLHNGLTLLREMPTPKITRPEIWLAVVTDALRIASDGWAAQALRLGWSSLELWGCSPQRGGNTDHEGLAVWIDGRRILLLDANSCIVESSPQSRSIFNRRSVAPGGVPLWNIGRAQ